jgi:drug/metabolite transporter (DMT)-like permease
MPLIAIVLVTIAAVIHAFWNLLGKRQNPSAAFFWVACMAASIVMLPLLLRDWHVLALIPGPVWALIASSCLFEAVYYTALAGAYRNGDMSLAYPLARALPTVLITLTTIILGIGKSLTVIGLVGIVAVAAGCMILPLRSLRSMRRSDYLNACCLLAVVAAVGTTGYTVIDSESLRILRALPGSGLSTIGTTLLYLALTSIGTALFIGLFIAVYPTERRRLRLLVHDGARYAVVAGLVITVGYAMVLVAMSYATNVSYIGAFRQSSIPLGAALGILVQKEPLYRAKVIGTVIILCGLLLVALA